MSRSDAMTILPCSRTVVTGAGGFIGQNLVNHLRCVGVPVLGVGHVGGANNAATVDEVLDLERPGVLEPWLDEQTVVFHLAGSADVRRSVASPADDFSANVVLTVKVLDAVRQAGCRMLFPSSGSVYDAAASVPYRESTPLRPSSPYGAAKMAAEAYCQAYHRSYGVDVRVARIFSVYGPGMRRFAIYDFFQRLRQNPERLVLRGDGGQLRDYLFVEDVARALVRIMSHGEAGETYNVASGRPRAMRDVARAVADAMDLPDCAIETDDQLQPGELYRMEADVSKTLALDFAGRVEFREGLATTVAWLETAQ